MSLTPSSPRDSSGDLNATSIETPTSRARRRDQRPSSATRPRPPARPLRSARYRLTSACPAPASVVTAQPYGWQAIRGLRSYRSCVAIPKVCGMETEYGIVHRGIESNPIAASSVLINAYVNELERAAGRVGWDFEDESPGNDARGFAREGAMPPEVETHLVNAVLTNGARYYVDHAHPEFSTPECVDALEVVRYDKAGER